MLQLSKDTQEPVVQSDQSGGEGQAAGVSGSGKTVKAQKEDTWTIMDKGFQKTLREAAVAYRTNYFLNLIIVAIGIILLASSLVFAWTRGINPDTLTFAGLGVVDFTSIFLVNPQFRIQQLLGDWEQIQMIYRTWFDQASLVDTFTIDPATGNYKVMTLDEVSAVNAELNKISEQAVSAVEKYIGVKPTKNASPTPQDGKLGQETGKPGEKKTGEAAQTS